MKIGILSDIHGDLDSLKTALAFLQNQAVDSIICAGDLVEKGQHDDQVVSILRDLDIPCVQGNHDENAIRHFELTQAFPIPEEASLMPETIEYLKGLPRVLELTITNTKILLTHATPSQNAGRVFSQDGAHRLSKRFKKDLARTDCSIVVVGHTHSPFDISFRGKRIINPGATCKLKGRDSHTAGILDLPTGEYHVFHLSDGSLHNTFHCEAT